MIRKWMYRFAVERSVLSAFDVICLVLIACLTGLAAAENGLRWAISFLIVGVTIWLAISLMLISWASKLPGKKNGPWYTL